MNSALFIYNTLNYSQQPIFSLLNQAGANETTPLIYHVKFQMQQTPTAIMIIKCQHKTTKTSSYLDTFEDDSIKLLHVQMCSPINRDT